MRYLKMRPEILPIMPGEYFQPSAIPIVFITAHRDETVRKRMLEQGAVECLFKPFSDTALLEALNAALRPN